MKKWAFGPRGLVTIGALLPVGVGILVVIGVYIWSCVTLEPFEASGGFRGLEVENGTTTFYLLVTREEADRVYMTYAKGLAKMGPIPIKNQSPWVSLDREAKGRWCGPVPAMNALVKITSQGFTKGVVIQELETGLKYRSKPFCP